MLTITHEIHYPMNEEYEIRGVFLKMPDAFDKVWHEGLVFKLKRNWISSSLLNVLEDFIRNRKQRFVLNGHLIVKIFMQTFPRFYLGTTVVHNLYQWFCRKSIDNSKTFCGWNFLAFFSAWSEYLIKKSKMRRNKPHHSDIIFNDNLVKKSSYQKHLEIFLNSNLNLMRIIKE